MKEDRLPTPEELGQEFMDELQADFEIQDYFALEAEKIVAKLSRKEVDDLISKYDDLYDASNIEDYDLVNSLCAALYCAYTEQKKSPEDFLKEVSNSK